MPRERIQRGRKWVVTKLLNDGKAPTVEDSILREWNLDYQLKPGEEIYEEPSLDLHWSALAENVQISFDAPHEFWLNFANSRDGTENDPSFGVFTDTLSRNEINHLIKTLRRARDAAYGADA